MLPVNPNYKRTGGCVQNLYPRKPKFNEQSPEIQKRPASEKVTLTIIKIDAQAPIQDFICLGEHEAFFRDFWRGESGT